MKVFSIITTVFLLSHISLAQTSIKGEIKDGKGKKLYLYKLVQNQPIVQDSVVVDKKGKYELKLKPENAFYRFGPEENDFALLILNKDSKQAVEINGNYSPFAQDYEIVSGSNDSKLAAEYLGTRQGVVVQVDSLMKANEGASSDKVAIGKELNRVKTEFTQYRNDFINNNPKSAALLMTLQDINVEQEAMLFKKVVDATNASMPESFYAKALNEQMSKMILPGLPAPDLVDKDTSGTKEYKLSDLKGKVVLLDFWASWCRPCRAENPNVVALYKKYNKDGFEVFSVSLDNNRDRWKQAVIQDNLIWPYHISDLKGWGTALGRKYGVSSIPHTVLIDRDGNILDLKLRGPQLEAKLAEIFGH